MEIIKQRSRLKNSVQISQIISLQRFKSRAIGRSFARGVGDLKWLGVHSNGGEGVSPAQGRGLINSYIKPENLYLFYLHFISKLSKLSYLLASVIAFAQ